MIITAVRLKCILHYHEYLKTLTTKTISKNYVMYRYKLINKKIPATKYTPAV